MKIAIDLLWLRPGKVGGTEFFVRNLLDGMLTLQETYSVVLLVSKDNVYTFDKYRQDARFELLVANIESASIAKRTLWQIFNQNRFLRKNRLRHCFVPVYCRPFTNGGIQYINTIHDIQVYHYPQYHPLHEVIYTKLCWWVDFHLSNKLVGITEYVKEDIVEHYKIDEHKIDVIPNPIVVNFDDAVSSEEIEEKWNVKEGEYFYTVSQMIPHKNIETLLKVMKQINEQKLQLPNKLLLSGINGNATNDIQRLIKEYNIENNVILTGFVSNEERNGLYKHCRAFLFPSIFEGFGMPPVEAMALGTKVITTKRTSIPEVTQNHAIYVENPFDSEEWIKCMSALDKELNQHIDMGIYDKTLIAKKYLELLERYFVFKHSIK